MKQQFCGAISEYELLANWKVFSSEGIIHLVHMQIFRKTNISYPLICTRISAYQG